MMAQPCWSPRATASAPLEMVTCGVVLAAELPMPTARPSPQQDTLPPLCRTHVESSPHSTSMALLMPATKAQSGSGVELTVPRPSWPLPLPPTQAT
jgi:hypothetical protein